MIGDEAFALLAMVSDELSERVEEFMRSRWAAERQSLIEGEQHRAGRAIFSEPAEDIRNQVDAILATYAEDWEKTIRRVRRVIARRRR